MSATNLGSPPPLSALSATSSTTTSYCDLYDDDVIPSISNHHHHQYPLAGSDFEKLDALSFTDLTISEKKPKDMEYSAWVTENLGEEAVSIMADVLSSISSDRDSDHNEEYHHHSNDDYSYMSRQREATRSSSVVGRSVPSSSSREPSSSSFSSLEIPPPFPQESSNNTDSFPSSSFHSVDVDMNNSDDSDAQDEINERLDYLERELGLSESMLFEGSSSNSYLAGGNGREQQHDVTSPSYFEYQSSFSDHSIMSGCSDNSPASTSSSSSGFADSVVDFDNNLSRPSKVTRRKRKPAQNRKVKLQDIRKVLTTQVDEGLPYSVHAPEINGDGAERTWTCRVAGCEKSFRSGAGMRYHLNRTHHTLTPRAAQLKVKVKNIPCLHCSKTFSTLAGLRYHRKTMVHTPEESN